MNQLAKQSQHLSISTARDEVTTRGMKMDNDTESTNETKTEEERSYHPAYVRKIKVRVKVRMNSGIQCIGDCHVLWPDGRTSDEINDERAFFLLTDATVEGEVNMYNILTLRKEQIQYMCEMHRDEDEDEDEKPSTPKKNEEPTSQK